MDAQTINGFIDGEILAMARLAWIANQEGVQVASLELSGGRHFAVQITSLKDSALLVNSGWGTFPAEACGCVFLVAFREISE